MSTNQLFGEWNRSQVQPDVDPKLVPAEDNGQSEPRKALLTDLSVIEAQCRLKAEGARWAAERQRRMHNGIPFSVAIEPHDRELIERAKQLGCFLWMCGPASPQPGDLGLFDALGSCLEAAADAAKLLRECGEQLDDEDELLKRCFEVAAEAQSALRSAVIALDGPADDDQQSIYEWLRSAANDKQIFIERYLRADDFADPYSSTDIENRLGAVREACQGVFARRRQRTRWLNRLRYHAGLVGGNGGTEHDWHVIALVADEMVTGGVAPSDPEIRAVMLPIIDALPQRDGLSRGLHLVVREIENYLASRPAPPTGQNESSPSNEVETVRNFLKGKRLVLVGGDQRDNARLALKEAFALDDVIWLDSQPHQSLDRFKPHILHDKVKIVALLIRWASHSYGELGRFCQRHGKMFVRLPTGYSPNQVANQIMAQCGYLLNQRTTR